MKKRVAAAVAVAGVLAPIVIPKVKQKIDEKRGKGEKVFTQTTLNPEEK